MNNEKVTLKSLNSGAALDLFESEFDKLLVNLADENTDAQKARTITLKLTVKPTANREQAITTVEVKSSLAPTKPHAGMVVFTSDGRNIEAYTVGQAKQLDLPVNLAFQAAEGGK